MPDQLTTTETPRWSEEDWDDLDWEIWDLIRTRHMSLRSAQRALAEHGTTISHEGIRKRWKRMMRRLTYPDLDELRTQEGHRLEALGEQSAEIAREAILCHTAAVAAARHELDTNGPVPVDPKHLETALRANREVRAVRRDMATLFGLDTRQGTTPPADAERINDLLGAYLAGHNDAKADAKASTEVPTNA
jgi:hypothetical protein